MLMPVSGERASHVLPNSTDPIDDTNNVKQLASDTISVCISGSDGRRTPIDYRAIMWLELGAGAMDSALR